MCILWFKQLYYIIIGNNYSTRRRHAYNVQIKQLASGSKTTFVIYTVFTDSMTALPAKIMQSQKQLMLFNSGNLYFLSPYS